MRDVKKAIREHYDAAIKQGIKPEQIIGIFLYGSQNYGVETEKSDVDTKCLYIPTLEQLTFNNGHSSIDYHLENDEMCILMDIRHFMENVPHQNVNYLEIMFNDDEYCYINPIYKDIWDEFVSKREELARYDVRTGILSQVYQAESKFSKPERTKDVSTAYRMLIYMEKYLNGMDYKECITITKGSRVYDKIIGCKMGNILSSDEFKEYAERIAFLKKEAKAMPEIDCNPELDDFIHQIINKFVERLVKMNLGIIE